MTTIWDPDDITQVQSHTIGNFRLESLFGSSNKRISSGNLLCEEPHPTAPWFGAVEDSSEETLIELLHTLKYQNGSYMTNVSPIQHNITCLQVLS